MCLDLADYSHIFRNRTVLYCLIEYFGVVNPKIWILRFTWSTVEPGEVKLEIVDPFKR